MINSVFNCVLSQKRSALTEMQIIFQKKVKSSSKEIQVIVQKDACIAQIVDTVFNCVLFYKGCLLYFGIREQKQIFTIENSFIVYQNIPH